MPLSDHRFRSLFVCAILNTALAPPIHLLSSPFTSPMHPLLLRLHYPHFFPVKVCVFFINLSSSPLISVSINFSLSSIIPGLFWINLSFPINLFILYYSLPFSFHLFILCYSPFISSAPYSSLISNSHLLLPVHLFYSPYSSPPFLYRVSIHLCCFVFVTDKLYQSEVFKSDRHHISVLYDGGHCKEHSEPNTWG